MPPETPQLQASLLKTVYSTFEHNNVVIAFFLATLLAAFLVFRQPNRFHLLLLFGFAILTFNYEYEKHIIAPLTEQTLKAVAPDPSFHVRTQRYLDIFISVIVPIALWILGWGLIFWAMLIGGKNRQKNPTV